MVTRAGAGHRTLRCQNELAERRSSRGVAMARWSIAVVDAEAARGGLGRRRAIHAERRLVELPVLAGITALALLLALRAGLAHSSLITAGLVPVVMLAVLGYRFVPPTGGARTVAVYERGFIEASNAGLRTVRWDEVSDVESTVSRSAWTTAGARISRHDAGRATHYTSPS